MKQQSLVPANRGRPKSFFSGKPPVSPQLPHKQSHSYSSVSRPGSFNYEYSVGHQANSKSATTSSNTFAPSFINAYEKRQGLEKSAVIEDENIFSEKRYVWLKDPTFAFVKGWIVEELEGDKLLVQCDDGSVSS